MWKSVQVAITLLLLGTPACAHVLPVPYSDVGSLRDVTQQAALGTVGGRQSAVPQITFNILSPPGGVTPAATCNGDVQTVTRNVTVTSGTNILQTSTSTFTAGVDVGKVILLPTWNNAGTGNWNTIVTVNSPTQVTLANNVLTGFSGTSTDITFGTSDSAAFGAFNTWARANQGTTNQVVLTIPNGSNCWFGSGQVISGISGVNFFAAFINNLIVEGTGATINGAGGNGFQLGGLGMCFQGLTATPGCSARIQTATVGASAITLTSASFSAGYISRFSVGTRILIGGLDPQALFSPNSGFGDPTNLWAFEWKTITAICNNTGACPGTAVITLDSPLTDSYSASWAQYNPGDQFHSDSGGPASIWAMNPSWETTVEYRGLTITQSGQTYAQGRNITYRNVTFTGDHGGIPTQNETFSAINTNYGFTNMETDKLVGTMLLDGVTIAKVVNQSTATKRFIARNSTFTIGLDGGAQYTEISDSNLGAWAPGIWVYGSLRLTDTTTCTRCTISSINYSFGPTSQSDFNYFTKSGGVITMPNSGAQGSGPGQRYFVPGALVYYATASTNPPVNFSCCESIGSFQVSTMTADPWPSITDNQTLTTTINISSASKNLNVPSGPFVSGDVGKTVIVNGAANSGGNLYTVITGFSSATDVTLYNAAGSTVAGSQTIQWGTSNTYINTNQSGGFPNTTAISSTNGLFLKTTGTPNLTCDVCNAGNPTSDGYGISLQAGAVAAKPLGAYLSKQYTPTSAQGDLATANARGLFKSLSINVTVAATAAGGVSLSPGGRFHWYMVDQTAPSAPTTFDWVPGNLFINLKQTGNRVITPSGVTCDTVPGVCSGDAITPPGNLASMWLTFGSMIPYMGSTHTGAPTFTITLQTDPVQ